VIAALLLVPALARRIGRRGVMLAAGTATTYLIELRVRQDPSGSSIRARNIGTSVNVGALGLGPLVAGCLAQWVGRPLTVPNLLFVALGAIALIGLASAPETGAAGGQPGSSLRSARVPVPAAAATLAAFSANGLFAGLAGLFLATTLGHPSHALAGALIGAGAGAVFKGTTGLVLEAAPPEQRLAMTSQLLITLFVGLSIPVIGAGVALDRGASAQDTVLGFAILVGLGVAGAGWALLGRRSKRAPASRR
jgi:hypothetical protein